MDYGGDEIYFKQEPSLVGKTYGHALQAYETSTVIGIHPVDGIFSMNPPMDTLIETGDKIVVIAEDDDKIILSELSRIPFEENPIQTNVETTSLKPEKALVLGWNRRGTTILRELDNYVANGSEVTIVSNINHLIKVDSEKLINQKIIIEDGDIRDRDLLERLEASEYDHVIVLAYSHLKPQEADAITLVTLLHLRDIAERDKTPFSIVSEMLDLRNRELAEAAKVDDFIVSEHLISLMMAQLSENPDLMPVFTSMFESEGSEIYLKPASDYISVGQPVNFYTIIEAASRRGETAIGYRLMSESRETNKSYGVHTNPKKSEKVVFTSDDKIIVLAEK
jgi:voltage-gated potassium channel Kch